MSSSLGKAVAILAAGIGLMLVFAATQLLTVSLAFPNVQHQSRAEIEREMTPWTESSGSVVEDEENYRTRQRSVTITESAGAVTVQWQLSSTRDDPIIRAAASGELLTAPDAFVGEVGRVGFSASLGASAWEPLSGTSPPDVVHGAGGTATATASSWVDLSDEHVLFSVHPSCAARRCAVDVTLTSDRYRSAGVTALPEGTASGPGVGRLPPAVDEVRYLEPTSQRFAVRERPISIVLVRSDSAAPVEQRGPVGALVHHPLWPAAKNLWRHVLSTVPWFLLLLVRAPAFIGGNTRRELWLLLSGLLLALYIANASVLGHIGQWVLRQAADGLDVGIPDTLAPPFHLAALLGVVWAPTAILSLTRSPSVRVPVLTYLVVLAALGVLVTTVSVQTRGPELWGPVAVVLLGITLIVAALSQYVRSAPIEAVIVLAGTATSVAGAALASESTTVTAWTEGIGTLVFNALFVATLLMIPVSLVVRSVWDEDRKRARRVFWLFSAVMFLLALWVALPRRVPTATLVPVGAWDVYPLANATVDAAKLGLFAALLARLWLASRQAPKEHLGATLALVWAVGSVMLLRPDSLYVGLPLAFLTGLVVLRAALTTPVPRSLEHQSTVLRIVREGKDQRLLRSASTALEKQVAGGQKTTGAVQEALQSCQRDISRFSTPWAAAAIARRRASTFGWGSVPAWRRGTSGAMIAALAGLPGFLQGLASLSQFVDARQDVPLLSASATIILILRYPLYGFFFGYFLPWIVGDTAVRKSLTLFAVLGVSESIVLLLPYQQQGEVVGAFVSWMAQLFFISFALGIFFDLLTLRRAGLGLDALLDVHHTSRVVASAYAVSVSVSAALTAAFATSAVDIIMDQLNGT